jgi:glycosyltransferase involved in cell wall biosynthesis
MVICQVVSGLMYGGGQKVALDLASRLDRQPGKETILVLLGERIAPGFPGSESRRIQVASYDGRYNRPSSIAAAVIATRKVLRRYRVDIAHSHGWDADVIVGLARRGLQIQHIAHQHILADWAASHRAVHRARRSLTRMALTGRRTHWVAVSRAVGESLSCLPWLPSEEMHIILNGVDVDRFSPPKLRAEGSRPVIGVAARLAPMKGLEYLIEAIAELGRREVSCELRVVGDGPSRSGLEAKIRQLGVADRVCLLGQRDDMPEFYRSIDVLALPSIALDGLPLSILEGMAMGLPVVSTFVSGIPEVVVQGVSGVLVPPRNAVALADALQPLLQSDVLRTRMGQEGRRRAERVFSLERMVTQVRELYDQTIRVA